MGGRVVLWALLSPVLGCVGIVAAARIGAPITLPYGFFLTLGWLVALVISLLLAWALRLLPGPKRIWIPISAAAALVSLVAADPVLVLIVAGYECGIENGLGGHCIFL